MIQFDRRPYPYQTSHRIDEVMLRLADGSQVEALLKHLSWSELGANAQRVKPDFLHDPQREILAYRILADAGLGTPLCYDAGEHWLLLEKVGGVELWQVGQLQTWMRVAGWLARFHARFNAVAVPTDGLIYYDASFLGIWPRRAARKHSELKRVAASYDRVVDLLCQQPRILIHGEFYASNILVAGPRVAPVDWEMLGVGPAALDVAALVSGWGPTEAAEIVAGYGDITGEVLDAARLHLAVQSLGWADGWSPPPQHARDWLAEARAAADRLGI